MWTFFAPQSTQATQPTQSTQPTQTQPASELEWNEFTSVDAPKDNTLWGAHKQLFDLDNLSNPSNAATQTKKPLGATLGATAPKPLGAGSPFINAQTKLGTPLGAGTQPLTTSPLGAPAGRVAPVPIGGFGAPVVQPGYAAYPGVVHGGYIVTPGMIPAAYPVSYGVPTTAGVPGMYARPPQQGFHM